MEDSENLISDIDIFIKSADNDINEIEKDLKPVIKKIIDEKELQRKEEMKKNIFLLLIQKERSKVTEILKNEFLRLNKVFTIRDDEKEEIWIYQNGIYIPNGKTFIKEFCDSLLGDVLSSHLINDLILKIIVSSYIDQKDFFIVENIDKICLQNGILDLKTLVLEDFSPKYKFFNKLPISFNPEKKCPAIEKHFQDVLKNPEDIFVIQEYFGFCLLRDYKFGKAIMMTGYGSNGKSKSVELLKRFLGAENCVNIPLEKLSEDQFILSELMNKLANIGSDINSSFIKDDSIFKNLTGQDLVTANRKFKNAVHFVNYAKMVFCANEIPRVNDLSDAFFRRWILLEFPYRFVDENEMKKLSEEEKINVKLADAEIINKLSSDDELSGCLNWSLVGLKRLLQNKAFSYSQSIAQVKESWIRKSDSFHSFVTDCCEIEYGFTCTKMELRMEYNKYCLAQKLKVLSDKTIKIKLASEFGVQETRLFINEKQEFGWDGIKFTRQGRQDRQGISTSREFANMSLASKTLSKLSTLSNFDEVIYESISEERIEDKIMTKLNHSPMTISDLILEFEWKIIEDLITKGLLILLPEGRVGIVK